MEVSFIPNRLATFSSFYKLWKMLPFKLSYFCQVYEKIKLCISFLKYLRFIRFK